MTSHLKLAIIALCLGVLTGCSHSMEHTMYVHHGSNYYRADCGPNTGSFEAPIHVCDVVAVQVSEVDANR